MTSGQIPIWSTVCKKLIIKSDGYPTVSRASWKLARLVHTSSKRKSHLSSRRVNWTWNFPYSRCRPSRKNRHEFELMVGSNFSSSATSSKRSRLIDIYQISCLDEILCVTCFHFQGTSRSLKKIENYFKAPSSSDVPDGIKIVATDNRE